MRLTLFSLSLLVPAALFAQQVAAPAVALTSAIQVVKDVKDGTGKTKRVLQEPTRVLPGDPLVVWLNYRNASKKPATAFVINNPIPAAMEYTAFGENSGWGLVSVDGGKTFGALATLKVTGKDGKPRPAVAFDVTHLRWTFKQPIAPGAAGTLSFYGVVK